jgi:uncharacterized protein (TIGR00251 family)
MRAAKRKSGTPDKSPHAFKAGKPTHGSIWVHVQPRAGKTEVVGMHDDAIKIRLKAPPVDGAANEELVRFLAKSVGVSRQDIRIANGKTSRRKRIKIDGMDENEVSAALGL